MQEFNDNLKILKIRTQKIIILFNCPKNKEVWFYNAVMRLENADRMANSADPDQDLHSFLSSICPYSLIFYGILSYFFLHRNIP